MLTKKEVERLKKAFEVDWVVWNVGELINNQEKLIETLESAMEVVKFYAKESYDWDHNDISDVADEFLAEYDKED